MTVPEVWLSVPRPLTLDPPALLRREYRDAFAGVHQPALDEVDVAGLLAGLVHGARERDPVQELLLAALLQLLQLEVTPGQIVAGLQLLESSAVRVDVGEYPVVLVGEEGVRPAGRA